MTTADAFSERTYGAATFAAFDPRDARERAAAVALFDRLVAVGFGPREAPALFGVADLTELRPSRVHYYDECLLPRDSAGAAARFLSLHLTQSDEELRRWLGDELVAFLARMRAIVAVDGGWRAQVGVTWFAERLIFADARAINVVWPDGEPFADLVMPPGGDSLGLLRVAPRQQRRAVLDLCCGAGAQSLAAAAYAERVVGVDLNPRALRFAAFNAAANRVAHAVFVHGDTYAPLGRERYDAILANPPFVPWPNEGAPLLFRGGGARGEDVVARIFAGAVERLEPDGWLTLVADLADVDTLPLRLHEWQGEARRTLILVQQRYELLAYAESHAAHLEGPARGAEVVRLLRHFADVGIRTLDLGYVIQDGHPGATHVVRTTAARNGPLGEDVAAWFAHQRRLAGGAPEDTVLALAPGVSLVRESVRAADGSLATVLQLLPGPHTLLEPYTVSPLLFELLERMTQTDVRRSDVTDRRCARELGELVDRGYVRGR